LTFTEVDGAGNRIAHVLAGLDGERRACGGLLIDNGLWSIPAPARTEERA
jgi:hypothetical protein